MRTWSSERRRLAALAMVTAALTGALWLALGGAGGMPVAGLYVAVAGAALFLPAGITVQVLAGQALVADLLLGQGGPHPLVLMPLVAGVVVTAELLAVVARLDTPLPCEPGDAPTRAWSSAALGGGVFGAVALVGGLPGPSGLIAVVLAAVACGVVALRLTQQSPER